MLFIEFLKECDELIKTFGTGTYYKVDSGDGLFFIYSKDYDYDFSNLNCVGFYDTKSDTLVVSGYLPFNVEKECKDSNSHVLKMSDALDQVYTKYFNRIQKEIKSLDLLHTRTDNPVTEQDEMDCIRQAEDAFLDGTVIDPFEFTVKGAKDEVDVVKFFRNSESYIEALVNKHLANEKIIDGIYKQLMENQLVIKKLQELNNGVDQNIYLVKLIREAINKADGKIYTVKFKECSNVIKVSKVVLHYRLRTGGISDYAVESSGRTIFRAAYENNNAQAADIDEIKFRGKIIYKRPEN